MKNLIILITSILFISCQETKETKKHKQIEKSDIQNLELNGKVKSLEEKEFEATEKFGESVKSKFKLWTITLFNSTGYKIEEKSFYEDGSISSVNNYNYNNENKIIKETYKCGDRNTKCIYRYDKYGNNIEFISYENSEISSKQVMKYDKKKNQVDWRLYEYDGVLNRKKISKYDKDNFKIEELIYEFNGVNCVYFGKSVMKYDENGNLIENNDFDEKGERNFLCKYVYDKKGNELDKVIVNQENLERKNTRKFNTFGHCSEEFSYTDGVLKENFKYAYNYDDKGNWTKRVHYINGIVTRIHERNIKYYK